MKTSTERSRERRKYIKDQGWSEVRGLYAPDDKHKDIKKNHFKLYPTPKKKS